MKYLTYWLKHKKRTRFLHIWYKQQCKNSSIVHPRTKYNQTTSYREFPCSLKAKWHDVIGEKIDSNQHSQLCHRYLKWFILNILKTYLVVFWFVTSVVTSLIFIKAKSYNSKHHIWWGSVMYRYYIFPIYFLYIGNCFYKEQTVWGYMKIPLRRWGRGKWLADHISNKTGKINMENIFNCNYGLHL